jgi:hypothetical protein
MLWQANFQFSQFGPSNLTFAHNLVIARGPAPLFQSPYNGTWLGDYNLYWNLSTPTPSGVSATFPFDSTGRACVTPASAGCVANASLEQWRAESGQDVHSLVVDPLLTGDPSEGVFTVAPDSPALTRLGMIPVTATPANTGPRVGKRRVWDQCTGAPSCGRPPGLVNGSVTGSPRWACGDTVVYQCNIGHVMSPLGSTWRRCLPDGNWSGSAAVCTAAPGPRSWLSQGTQLYDGNVLQSATSFLIQQGDGNLCLYSGSVSHNQGNLWCSGGQHSGETFSVVQPDGNFCTRDYMSNAAVWCSQSNQSGCVAGTSPRSKTGLAHTADTPNCSFFVSVDSNRVCVHRGPSPVHDLGTVWCAPNGGLGAAGLPSE